jgi:hypothetical protein
MSSNAPVVISISRSRRMQSHEMYGVSDAHLLEDVDGIYGHMRSGFGLGPMV